MTQFKPSLHRSTASRRSQQGISIFVVLVMVLLTTLFALWASRSALLNEKITGNDSDYQRAFEAAQAMVRDAELDILGVKPDGTVCAGAHCRPPAFPSRLDIPNKKVYFPTSASVRNENGDDLDVLQNRMGPPSSAPSCVAAICTPAKLTAEFWTNTAALNAMKPLAARYGEFTGATAASIGNPLLTSGTGGTGARAWYWVEPLRYQINDAGAFSGGSESRANAPAGGPTAGSNLPVGFVFRITAVAEGLKPGTQAVVQTIFVPQEVIN